MDANAGNAQKQVDKGRTAPSRQTTDVKFRVGPRYKVIKSVGAGAYGLVWSAIDLEDPPKKNYEKGNVAIKKVPNPFSNKVDAKRLMREVLLISALKHPNILTFRDMIATEEEAGTAMYIVTDLMDIDLHKVISSRQALTERHVVCFMSQILKGLKYLHSAGILHRDMKPSNILVNEDCELKICDFGLARPIPRKAADEHREESKGKFMTEYVVTRWYRSPELLLQETYYTTAIDVWSAGCILAELLGRRPLFPGSDYIEQLLCITSIVGTPKAADIHNVGSQQAQNFIKTLEEKEAVPFSTIYPKASPEVHDLLAKMLKFNYRDRITVDEALAHPFLQESRTASPPLTAEKRFLFEYDGANLSLSQMKEIVLREVAKYHPEIADELEELHKTNLMQGERLPVPLPEKEGEDAPIQTAPRRSE
eukprot:TRINITY_DN6107_c0_g1_i1.p1 TRINITY_DN6107_c0_g1~~TRINITY_DN6107_c0_g1_i1.p1  ORF type:complete len:468 (+),score=134.04 TRINITY_DN6107_c0_g1_i1:136-1404(+)